VQESKKPAATAPDMQRAVSKTGATPKMKVEGTTPVTAGSMMGRRASHLGGKSSSPASNILRTPQPSMSKGPGSTNLKPTPSKDDKKDTTKQTGQAGSPEGIAAPDPWADCPISFEAIRDAFSCLGEPGFPGLFHDPADELLNSDVFTQMQSKDTPQSIDTGANTQTPRDSDISKDDDLDILIGGKSSDNPILMDWVNLTGEFEGGLLMQDPFDEMEWEAIDRKEAEGDLDYENIPVYSI
jgi:hypothetical protein